MLLRLQQNLVLIVGNFEKADSHKYVPTSGQSAVTAAADSICSSTK